MTKSTRKQKRFRVNYKNTAQKMAYNAYKQHDVLFLIGPAGVGKALTMESKVYTPEGYKLMRDIQIGDLVATPDGNSAPVIGVYPQGFKDIYRVEFDDGTHVDCCKEHLWQVSDVCNGWKNKVVTTDFIIRNYRNRHGRKRLYLDVAKAVNHDRKDYFIDPYLLGILISEGNLTNANVVFSTADQEICDKAAVAISEDYTLRTNGRYDHRIVKKKHSGKTNIYKQELKQLGLWGKKSYEKFIPENYLLGAVDQRISLLQGLMDGNGTVNKKTGRYVEFSTASERLANDVRLLVNSLGGIVRIRVKENCFYKKDEQRVLCRPSFRCNVILPSEIKAFSLPRKQRLCVARKKYFPRRYISNVVYKGNELAQCIAVASSDNLYLTENYIVTHNTHCAVSFAIEDILNDPDKKKIILTRPIVESGESLGYLPGDFHEKVNPYMMPFFDIIDDLIDKETDQRRQIDEAIDIIPLAYMRGRTFNNAVCIFDEAQNATFFQLKLFLSRFQEGSKLIITGDPLQSDLNIKATLDLVDVVRRLENLKGIGIIQFKNDSIVRHPLVGDILERLEQ